MNPAMKVYGLPYGCGGMMMYGGVNMYYCGGTYYYPVYQGPTVVYELKLTLSQRVKIYSSYS